MIRRLCALALAVAAACAADPVQEAAGELERRGVPLAPKSLYRSLRTGDLETVELLITAGVHPNPALLRALEVGRCEALEIMLAAGFPRDNGVAAAALLVAQDRGQGDCVAALRRAAVTLDGSFRGVVQVAVRLAALRQGPALRQAAVFGLSLEPKDDYGRTPLLEMVRRRSAPGVACLIAAGADVDAADRAGETALHLALWRGHEDLARQLLEGGADPRQPDRDGWSALHVAARTGSLTMVRELLARGASPAARTREGWTAGELAELEGHVAVAVVLRSQEPPPVPGSTVPRGVPGSGGS